MLYVISSVAGAVVFRVSGVVVAAMVAESRFGILNRQWTPPIVKFGLAVVSLDLVRYVTHRVFHGVALLWRIHEVHHSDPDYDVSTAVRFHPLEVAIDQAIFLAAVATLAPSPAAVFASELLTTALNLFSHANASLPEAAEGLAGWVLITPSVHRIHHSQEISDQAKNFGQTFCWWDRLFGTFQEGRREGAVVTGIEGMRAESSLGIMALLRAPFARRK